MSVRNFTTILVRTTTTIMTNDDDDDDDSEEEEEEENEEDSPYEFLNFGVPIAIMGVIVFALCMIVVYTKIRRRNQRARGIQRDTAPNISGGVAMNVNVYRNYGVYVNNVGSPGLGPGNETPVQLPAYAEQPPAYEDIAKETGDDNNTGIANAGFTGTSRDSVAMEGPPPSYSPAEDSQRSPGGGGDNVSENTASGSINQTANQAIASAPPADHNDTATAHVCDSA